MPYDRHALQPDGIKKDGDRPSDSVGVVAEVRIEHLGETLPWWIQRDHGVALGENLSNGVERQPPTAAPWQEQHR